ncbi:MAG: chemotaxis protein CheC [Endomicrobiales bacterium]|nr:chemotaxis protein CheC [Endomicrobiales bacterium]
MNHEFSAIELDAIQEICNIASGNAAGALSQVLNKRINMKVPEIKIVPVELATEIMGESGAIVAGVYSRLIGDFNGGLLLTFPREDVILLVDKLVGSPSKTHTLSELDVSAISEVGNIICASFVGAISKIINKTVFISVPKLAFDMLGAIVDFILIELAENAEQALIMKIQFEDVPKTISGHFFILPNPGSLEMLLNSIKCRH